MLKVEVRAVHQFSQRRQMLSRKQQYDQYINSPAWRAKRDDYFESDLPQGCQGCGYDGVGLHLHHKTYDRLGAEKLTDLVPVCETCHDRIHDGFNMWRDNLWAHTENVLDRIRKEQAGLPAPRAMTPIEVHRQRVEAWRERQGDTPLAKYLDEVQKAKAERTRTAREFAKVRKAAFSTASKQLGRENASNARRKQKKQPVNRPGGKDANNKAMAEARARQEGRGMSLEERRKAERRRNGLPA